MTTIHFHSVKQWIKQNEHPCAKTLHTAHSKLKNLELRMPNIIATILFTLYQSAWLLIEFIRRTILFTPMLRCKTKRCGKNLYLYGGLPFIAGPLNITIGDDCRISGRTTITGRYSNEIYPALTIGNNVDIGWQSTIAVGREILIGDNVRIAGSCFLGGYPGHPIDAFDRAMGLPCTDSQAKNITLEHDVWIGTGVTIIGGVRIGHSTIVAAGSVVTKSLPNNVLAGGNPARVIRKLSAS